MQTTFDPESGEWFTKEQMRKALRIGDPNTIDNWRRKFDYQSERTESKGKHRGVWLLAPEWLPLYFAAVGSGVARVSEPSAGYIHKDRKEHFESLIAEVKYRQLIKEFLLASEVESWLSEFASGLSVVATIADKQYPDVAGLLKTFLDSERQKLESRLHVDSNGHTTGPVKSKPARVTRRRK